MPNFKWTNENDEYLRTQWLNKRVVDIADDLGVSKHVIMRRARKLNIEKKDINRVQSQYYLWTDDMDEYLRSNYLAQSNQYIASRLNISIQALMRRMKKLRLSRGTDEYTHFKWQEEDINRLTALFDDGVMIHDIAEAFGISKQAVKRKLKALGLSRTAKNKELM